MTDINDIKRELEALTAKVAAYEAEKATKRNWPERIEAGMCFAYNDGCVYIYGDDDAKCLTCIKEVEDGDKLGWSYSREGFQRDKSHFTYLGHARDILTIRADAHEPTGAELVGHRVEVTNDPGGTRWLSRFKGEPIVISGYNLLHAFPYKTYGAGDWIFARLAK